MAVKDRIRKQIKKQNAPELTKEQIVGKIEREVKRKHREKKRSCWKSVLQNKLKLPLTPHAHWKKLIYLVWDTMPKKQLC